MKIITYLSLFSALSFLAFGIACFTSTYMTLEFKRYELVSYQKIVGALQILGGLGLVIGLLYFPILQAIAAAGLALLMVLGFMVRIKIRDTVIQATPSLFFALLNFFILYKLIY